MSRIAIVLGLAMTAVICPSGDAATFSKGETDALHLMLILHANSVFDGVPRLPATGCPPFAGQH